jgi:hypothetical protein
MALGLNDLFLTPLYLVFFYGFAYAIRGRVTNTYTKPYFIPALTLKFVGAIALGLIYTFYYHGGDTINYYTHASVVNQAFHDSFEAGWKLLTTNGDADPVLTRYTSQMYWFGHGSNEYFIVRVAGFLSLIDFNTYTVTALFFAAISFSGVWAMYMTFAKIRPVLYKELAVAVFFIPSVFFWGSGLMKDSLCLGALGWIFYAFYRGAIEKRNLLKCMLIGAIAAVPLISTKIYILLAFLPPALLWVFNENNARIKSPLLRTVARPVFLGLGGALAFFATTRLTAGDERFDVDKIGERSKITAEYLYEVSQKQEGSGYYLGKLDGTIGGMAKLAPQAVVVTLFRPFLWEARNPVMLLSAIEATYFLFFTLRIFYRNGFFRTLRLIAGEPVLTLCFVFALIFAVAVGTSTSNFGTLVRYKIPLIPFYVCGLLITQSMAQPVRKRAAPAAALRPALR